MKLGDNGNRMAMLAAGLGAALATSPEQAEAQDFNAYCGPLANGEVLESELTPQNMGYIFDDEGRVIAARADELTQHFGDGISETCGTGDVGAYVSQYGRRVMLEIYPPGQYPLGIAPETMQEIQANYAACVGENLRAVDDNGNGVIDAGEDREFYEFTETLCNERLQSAMQHAGRMAAMNAEQEAIYDRIAARTEAIIEGARREAGL